MSTPNPVEPTQEQFTIKRLGAPRHDSPLQMSRFVGDDDRIVYHVQVKKLLATPRPPLSFLEAGPRRRLFFDPGTLNCGIVTCGGLCPGLNDVIRALVLQLTLGYGVPRVVGFQYGYEGLCPRYGHIPLELDRRMVRDIHETGGTILGTSRGMQDTSEMVDTLEQMGIGVLFCLGGDGTLRGAHAIHEEITRRGLPIGVVGVPKTIDNDISFIQTTFGLETAVSVANSVITGAHTEAHGTRNCVAIVKLMGRDSGFIAAYASMASGDANFCLVPECPFELEGENGLLACLHRRLTERDHAVIVVAEGAGANLLPPRGTDASGNVLHGDIGAWLQTRVDEYLKANGFHGRVLYIDPSYIVRSVPANAHDSVYCAMLAQHAAHAALAGLTDLVVGNWSGEFTYVPIPLATSERKKIDLDSDLWQGVLLQTGQPMRMG